MHQKLRLVKRPFRSRSKQCEQCFALFPQVNSPANNLNLHWSRRWWDRIQAIFLKLYWRENLHAIDISSTTYLPHLLNILKNDPLLHNSGQPPIKCWRVSSTYDYKQLSLNGFSEIALYPCTTIGLLLLLSGGVDIS